MRDHRYRWYIVGWLALFCTAALPAWAAEPSPRSVLILDESAGGAGGPFYQQIVSALRGTVSGAASPRISIFAEYLDFSRFRGTVYEDGLAVHLQSKYRDKPISVIVAIGHSSLQYVVRYRTQLWPNVPVVFAFVETSVARDLKLPSDITGITFDLKLSSAVDAARTVLPDLSKVVIVGDALDIQAPYQHFKDEIALVRSSGIEVLDFSGMTIRELRKRLADLPPRTAIIYTSMYSDGEGTFLSPQEALTRFADVANRPIITLVETQVGSGAIGGAVIVPAAVGQSAASVVLRILNGESALAIPVSEGNVVKPIFDWRQMRRWNVTEAELPSDSEVRFRQPTAWNQYHWQIVSIALAVLLQTLLINWLLHERRRRLRSDAMVRNTIGELAQMDRVATGNELSASIAHEVMQPLTGMVASANAGLRWLSAPTPDLDKARTMLAQIVTAGHRAADVVRAVRAIFKKDGQIRQPVQMNSLIIAILDIVRNDLEKCGIVPEVHLDPELPELPGDPIQLQQVVLNLVVNAIDAMKVPTVGTRALDIRSETTDGGIRVSVDDSGPGIGPDMLDQIFKPLFTTKEGMGLGLAICRSIIQAHQGRIWASSRKPKGLTVQFHLPLRASEI